MLGCATFTYSEVDDGDSAWKIYYLHGDTAGQMTDLIAGKYDRKRPVIR